MPKDAEVVRGRNCDTFTSPSFGLGNRLARLFWNFAYVVLFRFSPRPFHFWRRFLLRIFGASIGPGVHIYPKCKIWAPWMLVCDEGAGVADDVEIYNIAKVRIGKRAVVSQGTYLCTGSHDYRLSGMPLFAKPIVVGENAWVAARCFVMPGVVIEEGCVIGACSVVGRSMPSGMICYGHPCVPVKVRGLSL